MRTGVAFFALAIAFSVLLHVAAVFFAIVLPSEAKLVEAPPAETVTVDIVAPQELPQPETLDLGQAPPPSSTAAAARTAPRSTSAAPQAPAQPQQVRQTPQPQPPPAPQSPFDPTKLAAMFPLSPIASTDADTSGLTTPPAAGFDAPADKAAQLASADVAAFKAHLRKCLTLPPGLGASDKLRVVLRVALKPDGALSGQPMLLEATASPYGPAMVESVSRALRQCQPYNFLPAEKYAEWRLLDLSFTPRDMVGG